MFASDSVGPTSGPPAPRLCAEGPYGRRAEHRTPPTLSTHLGAADILRIVPRVHPVDIREYSPDHIGGAGPARVRTYAAPHRRFTVGRARMSVTPYRWYRVVRARISAAPYLWCTASVSAYSWHHIDGSQPALVRIFAAPYRWCRAGAGPASAVPTASTFSASLGAGGPPVALTESEANMSCSQRLRLF